MARSELITQLATRFSHLVIKDSEIAIAEFLGAIGEALAQGHRVEIRGFGTFGINYRLPCLARNPKTGEKVNIGEKYVPHFKAGKELL